MTPPIIIYSTPSCGYCKLVKEYLASKSIPFTEVDVVKEPSRQAEMLQKSGGVAAVPVIDVGGKIIMGFDRHRLDEYIASGSTTATT